MLEFLLALTLFVAAHVLPARLGLRPRAVAAIGERSYLILYSAVSLALLAWLVAAATGAPIVPLWPTSLFFYHVALALMLPASMLLVGGMIAPNPLSISFGAGGYDPERPGLAGVTRHPLLWGFALWAVTHILANGELVPLIMFGFFALMAFGGMAILDRRKRRQLGARWTELAASTSVLPFAAWTRNRRARRWRAAELAVTLFGGVAFYLLLLWLHPHLIGPDPAALLL